MYLVDSHCHLDIVDPTLTELDHLLTRAKDSGVGYILNVCVSINEFAKSLDLAIRFPHIGASVGLHPNDLAEEVQEDELIKLATHPKVIAIGETGLDYFRSTGDLRWQQDRFRRHIRAAKCVNKPLIVHTRAAKEDTIRIMREEGAEQGVMHCFTEDWETAKKALDLGFYISFSGIVTFKNAAVIQSVAKQIPLTRILIETDAPYLAPEPHRGRRNEPAYVRYTAEYLANLHGVDFDGFAHQTSDNFFNLFTEALRPHV